MFALLFISAVICIAGVARLATPDRTDRSLTLRRSYPRNHDLDQLSSRLYHVA